MVGDGPGHNAACRCGGDDWRSGLLVDRVLLCRNLGWRVIDFK